VYKRYRVKTLTATGEVVAEVVARSEATARYKLSLDWRRFGRDVWADTTQVEVIEELPDYKPDPPPFAGFQRTSNF
jgi:hypothetical protein